MATASVTNTFVNGTTADADEVNTNFTELVGFLNNQTLHKDGSKALTGSLDFSSSYKAINVSDPTAAQDAATKNYVDGVTYLSNAITTAMIQTSAVTTTKINDLAVTTAKIANGAVDTTQLADDSVTNAKIDAGAVGTTELDDLAVSNAKLGTNAVSLDKMQNNSVDTNEIVNSAVTTNKIANDAVTAPKLDTTLYENGVQGSSSTTITATTEGTAQTIVTQNVTCAAGSIAVITGTLDILVTGDPFDTINGLLFINGTREPGRLICSWPDWNAATLNGGTYGRDCVSRTWIVSMPAMSSDPITLRVYKGVDNGGTAIIQSVASSADRNSRLQVLIFNAS